MILSSSPDRIVSITRSLRRCWKFLNRLQPSEVSRLDIDDEEDDMECNCGMPLCICVDTSSQSTIKPNTSVLVTLPQSDSKPKTETLAKSKSSSSNSNSRSDNPQKDYEVNGEGLREAIKNGDIAGVKKLLKQSVDANYHDRQGMSVLHLTALFNQTEITLLLMEHGASLEDKNAQGETPFDCAPATLQYKMREKMEKMKPT